MRGFRPIKFQRIRVTREMVTQRMNELDARQAAGGVGDFKIIDVKVAWFWQNQAYGVTTKHGGTKYYSSSERETLIDDVLFLENIPLMSSAQIQAELDKANKEKE